MENKNVNIIHVTQTQRVRLWRRCSVLCADDEYDDDEQKNKLIFIFYRYVSSNERVSYSLTPEYIHFFLFQFLSPAYSFNGFKHIFRCAPSISLTMCVCVYLYLFRIRGSISFRRYRISKYMLHILLFQNDSFVMCVLLLLWIFLLFCFILFRCEAILLQSLARSFS